MPAQFPGGIEVPLAEGRTSTAFSAIHQHDVEAERFEHFYRCDADMRLVIADEGIVPQDDLASFRRTPG